MVMTTLLQLIAFLAFVLALVVIFYENLFHGRQAIRQKLRQAAHFPINQFPEGALGKIVGQVVYLGQPLAAPLSGRQCTQYHVLVEERSQGQNITWNTMIETDARQDFIVQDATGEALVKMDRAQVLVIVDKCFQSGIPPSNAATPQLEEFLAKHGHRSTKVLGTNRPLRYQEGVLERGKLVVVCGQGHWVDDPVRPASRQLVLNQEADARLYVSDDESCLNGDDGTLSKNAKHLYSIGDNDAVFMGLKSFMMDLKFWLRSTWNRNRGN